MTKKKVTEEFLKLNPKIKEEELSWKMDGRLEWICEHNTGHTVYDPKGWDYIHGCCDYDCCKKVKVYTEPERDEADDWHDEYKRSI